MIDVKWCGYCKSDVCRCIVEGVVYPSSIWYHEPCGYCHNDPCCCDGLGNWISMHKYQWRLIRAQVKDENARIAYRNAIAKMH
jgi:hypothetical protein